jgi:hypothetical protein
MRASALSNLRRGVNDLCAMDVREANPKPAAPTDRAVLAPAGSSTPGAPTPSHSAKLRARSSKPSDAPVENCKAMAEVVRAADDHVVTGGTDTHLLLDLQMKPTGDMGGARLGRANFQARQRRNVVA